MTLFKNCEPKPGNWGSKLPSKDAVSMTKPGRYRPLFDARRSLNNRLVSVYGGHRTGLTRFRLRSVLQVSLLPRVENGGYLHPKAPRRRRNGPHVRARILRAWQPRGPELQSRRQPPVTNAKRRTQKATVIHILNRLIGRLRMAPVPPTGITAQSYPD